MKLTAHVGCFITLFMEGSSVFGGGLVGLVLLLI